MSQPKVLILQNFDFIYPSLYDLFNQNYTEVSGKKYARIALGYTNNSLSEVNDNFRCIILLDGDEIKNQDPPFLNRFEKHILSFDYFIKENQIFKEIYEQIESMLSPIKEDVKVLIDIKNGLINYDEEEIKAIIYQASLTNKENHKIYQYVLEKIVLTFNQEIMFFINTLGKIDTIKKTEIINKKYNQLKNKSFESFLSTLIKEVNKNIIYTYSNVSQEIKITSEIQNKDFGKITQKSIKYVQASSIYSEKKLESLINDFYINKELLVMVIKFRIVDFVHLNHIRECIDNLEKEQGTVQKKVFIILIHLYRKLSDEEWTEEEEKLKTPDTKYMISRICNYNQIFIDDLNGNIQINNLLNSNNKQIYENQEFINWEKVIDRELYSVFTLFKFEFEGITDENQIKEKKISLIKKIIEKVRFKKIMTQQIIKELEKEENITSQVFYKDRSVYERYDTAFAEILKKFAIKKFKNYVAKFIYKTGINGLLLNVLTDEEYSEKDFENLNLSEVVINEMKESNVIKLNIFLNYPKYNEFYEIMRQCAKTKKNEYLQLDYLIRFGSEEESTFDNINDNTQKKESINIEQNKKQLIIHMINEIDNNSNLLISKTEQKEKINENNYNNLKEDFYKKIIQELDPKYDNISCCKIIELLIQKTNITIEKNNYKEYIASIIIWIESYSHYINLLCSLHQELFLIAGDKINESLEKQNTNSPTNQIDIKPINKPFYDLLEAMLSVIFDDQKITKSIESIQTILQKGLELDIALNLSSHTIYKLDNLMKVSELLKKYSGEFYEKDINEYYNILKNDTNDSFEKQIKFLKGTLNNNENIGDLIMPIIINKFKLYSKQTILDSQTIISSLIDDEKLHNNLHQFLKAYFTKRGDFKDILPKEEDFLAQFDIPYDERDVLNINGKYIFDDILLFFFETIFNNFFSKVDLNDIQNSTSSIFHQKNISFFEQSIEVLKLNVNDEKQYKHLRQLKAIAYIKCYLYYFVKFLMNNEIFQKIQEKKEQIINILDSRIGKHIDTIKMYMFKLFLKNKKMNYDDFLNIDWEHLGIKCKLELKEAKMRTILTESHAIPLEEYLLIEYFMIPNYPCKEDFSTKFNKIPNKETKYPIINTYLSDAKTFKILENLNKINLFANKMLKTNTSKRTRQQVETQKIEDTTQLFKDFKEGWNNLKKEAKIKDLPTDVTLDYALNDNKEGSNGEQLKKIYEYFIKCQNDFLNNLIDKIKEGPLYSLVKLISKESYKIDVQNATPVEIVTDNIFQGSTFSNFDDMIIYYSHRNCYTSNSLDYNNYQEVVYNFDEIEKELGLLLLKGKKLFTHNQKYVTYFYELDPKKPSLREIFKEKNPQEPLTTEEIEKIKQAFDGRALSTVLDQLYSLINYFSETNYPKEKTLDNLIMTLPNYVCADDEFQKLFREDLKGFTIQKILGIYDIIEQLYFPETRKKAPQQFKNELNENQITIINDYFGKPENTIIKKEELAGAIRLYVYLYLQYVWDVESEKSKLVDKSLFDEPLFDTNKLWDKTAFDNKITKDYLKQISNFEIKINQLIAFYDYLIDNKKETIKQKGYENKNQKKPNKINSNY